MHSLTDKEFGTMSEICSMVVPNEPSSLSLKSIRTKGTIPSPRSNFSICKFSPHQVFLYGGSNEEDDLSDAYILDLISMSWAKVDIAINFPLVGHQSVTLHRSLNQTRPSIYIFGGWNGSNYFNKSLLIDPEDFKVMVTTCDESFMDSPPEPTNKHLSSSNPNPKTLMKSVSLFVTPPKAPKTSQFCPMTPNGGEKSFIFKEALTNSDHFRNAKRITWMGTTNSDKTQSGNTLKIGFDGKIPSSRKDHTLTVDSKGKRLFLFGGWNSSATDESDLLCMWVLGSNWQWTKLLPEGDIPSIRRGHTSVCIENDDALIIYGGCSGYNGILDDCYHYHIQTNRFKKIKPIEAKFYPEGRAWHSAFLIDQWIYYYGGLKLGLNPTKEVIAFDFNNHMWFNLNYTTDNSIRDLERFGHGAISINTSILVFGGTAFQLADKHTLGLRPREKKISLEEMLVFETYNGTPLDVEGLKMIIPEKKPKEGVYALDQSGVGKIKPPPIPQEFQNPKNLLEEQTNFWHWNPHIFPEDANRRKIHYFKHKAEEEAIKSKTSNIYVDFEGLDDDESTSPTFSKSSQQFEVI